MDQPTQELHVGSRAVLRGPAPALRSATREAGSGAARGPLPGPYRCCRGTRLPLRARPGPVSVERHVLRAKEGRARGRRRGCAGRRSGLHG